MRQLSFIKHPLNFLLIFLLFSNSLQGQGERYSVSFEHIPLKTALDALIDDYNLILVYQNRHVEGWDANFKCDSCSVDHIIENLLKGTHLIWKRKNRQIIISKQWFTPLGRTIKGVVQDHDSGEPLPYANVFIHNSFLGDITNSDGYFSIAGVPNKTLKIQCSHMGYGSKTIEIENGKNTPQLKIQLKSGILQGKDITVFGENETLLDLENEGSRISISPRLIGSLPSVGERDFMRSLQLLPGISMGDMGKAGLFIRGGTPDQNLIIFDGITLYHVDHFFGFFSAFNPSAVKNVQVFKGAYPAKYGGRMSSVLELSGRNGNTSDIGLSLNTNMLATGFTLEHPLNRRGSFFLSFRRSHVDVIRTPIYDTIYNFITGEDKGGISSDLAVVDSTFLDKNYPRFFFYDLNSKVTIMPGLRDIVSLSVYLGQDHYNQSLEEISIGPDINKRFRFEMEDKNKWGNKGASVRWAHQWSSGIYSNLFFANSQYQTQYSSKSVYEGPWQDPFLYSMTEINSVNDITVRLENEWTYSSTHTYDFGIGFSHFKTVYETGFGDMPVIQDERTAPQFYLYFQDRWTPISKWMLTAGLRSNYYKKLDRIYFEPRISGRYSLTSKINIKGAVGVYYQFINRFINENTLDGANDFWIVSDEWLPPGRAMDGELGLSLKTKTAILSIEGFYKVLKNIVEFERLSALEESNSPFHVGEGVSKGVEFFIKKQFGAFHGWFSYSHGKVEYTFPGINGGRTYLANHDRTHELKWVNIYKKGSWNFSSTWVFSSGQVYTAPENLQAEEHEFGYTVQIVKPGRKNLNRLEPIHRWDLGIHKSLRLRVISGEVGLTLINVYNFSGITRRKVNTWTNPLKVTDVKMMPFTPSIQVQLSF